RAPWQRGRTDYVWRSRKGRSGRGAADPRGASRRGILGGNQRLAALEHLEHRPAALLDLLRARAKVRPFDQPDVLTAPQHQRRGVESVLLGAEVHRDQTLQRLLVDLAGRR